MVRTVIQQSAASDLCIVAVFADNTRLAQEPLPSQFALSFFARNLRKMGAFGETISALAR